MAFGCLCLYGFLNCLACVTGLFCGDRDWTDICVPCSPVQLASACWRCAGLQPSSTLGVPPWEGQHTSSGQHGAKCCGMIGCLVSMVTFRITSNCLCVLWTACAVWWIWCAVSPIHAIVVFSPFSSFSTLPAYTVAVLYTCAHIGCLNIYIYIYVCVCVFVSVSQARLQEAFTFTELLHHARWIAFSLSITSSRIWRQ